MKASFEFIFVSMKYEIFHRNFIVSMRV